MSEYIKHVVDHYYGLTIRNLRESVPKSVAFNFIHKLRSIRGHVLIEIGQCQDLESFLDEDPMIVSKRKYHHDILKILEKSEKIMSTDDE